jgi:hypothetical protein
MFRDGLTGRTTAPGEKMVKLVVERRPRVYFNEDMEKIGEGWEIVREISTTQASLAGK